MKEKKFVYLFLILFFLLIAGISLFNYKIDSAYLFSKQKILENVSDDLLAGKIVSGIENCNDRYLQQFIIEKINIIPKVIILGSSRIMLLRSSHLKIAETGDYFNHAVVAARLNDYIGILGCYKKRGEFPKTIIIEVTPWLFDKRSKTDLYAERWQSIASEYYYLKSFINDSSSLLPVFWKLITSNLSKLKELISYGYTSENYKALLSKKQIVYTTVPSTAADGYLKVPDGSMYYPLNIRMRDGIIAEMKALQQIRWLQQHNPDKSLQSNFFDLVQYLLSEGTEVVFFLPPYHPYVYHRINKYKKLKYVNHYEQLVRSFAISKQIPVLGSFNPNIFPLSGRDFLDGVHTREFGTEKIFSFYQHDAAYDSIFGNGYSNHKLSNSSDEKWSKNILDLDQKKSDKKDDEKTFEPSLSEYHWLEAEHADSIISPLEVASDKNASGGKYIFSPNGTGNQYAPGSVMATYSVNIAQAGEYVLWGRVIANNGKDDSFIVQIDSAFNNVWSIAIGTSWHWDEVNNGYNLDSVKFFLNRGQYTIKIKLREDGARLDKLLLTNNIDFSPSGKGNSSENLSAFDDG